ncbi:MAG: T9SS type A sorting domain-containing protein [Bacteroidales bacterium]|nr:T9SS type A sorting domain-containing protein [Bacteroidales bacterium]
MKLKQIQLIGLLIAGLGLNGLSAQETLPASGGYVSNNESSVSYTIGQVVYTTNGNSIQGVQQPYEIFLVSTIEEARDISLRISVFPNPTIDFLTLKIIGIGFKNLSFSIYDIQGKLLENKIIDAKSMTINMEQQSSGIYFLKVKSENEVIKTFKILKK